MTNFFIERLKVLIFTMYLKIRILQTYEFMT